MSEIYDIAVIGAGMAGASIAAESGRHASVIMLEAEATPGYHTTGRSAAFWEECYGGPEIVPLTLASGRYLRDHGFLSPRGALYIGRAEDKAKLDSFMDRFGDTGVTIERIGRTEMLEHVPDIRPEWCDAIWEPACADIDVAGLHQHYLKAARRAGVELRCNARVEDLTRSDDQWTIALGGGGNVSARTVVNAAGAWADPVAALAGAVPLGIVPLRRTVAQLRIEPPPTPDQPLVLDISGQFYFKPDGAKLWLSPHDETPDTAHDVAPEELDVAIAIDRFESVIDCRIAALERKWAGLRSFAPDRAPVYGFDSKVPGFFWFAGQGGYGIQTAPAAARLGAQLLLDLPRDELTAEIDDSLYAPGRFASGG